MLQLNEVERKCELIVGLVVQSVRKCIIAKLLGQFTTGYAVNRVAFVVGLAILPLKWLSKVSSKMQLNIQP